MGQVGTKRETIEIPEPIVAPNYTPPVKVPEPQREPQREPVPVRRES